MEFLYFEQSGRKKFIENQIISEEVFIFDLTILKIKKLDQKNFREGSKFGCDISEI